VSDAILEQVRRGEPITACQVIDCHGHIGPPSAFHSAETDAAGMLRTMDRLGIRQIVISSCASILGGSVRAGNDLTGKAVSSHPDRFIGYCAVDGNYPGEVRGELERGFEVLGLTHIKLHPGTDEYPIDGPGYADVWPFAEERGVVVLIHTWQQSPATPAACAKIAERFPNLRMLLGHAGGPRGLDEAARVARDVPNLFLDTVLSMRRLGRVEYLVEQAGVGKVLYGSDLPFLGAVAAVGQVAYARLSEAEKRAVFGENARRLFGL
jgi:hypothetical protein